jgi:hypothetical protein
MRRAFAVLSVAGLLAGGAACSKKSLEAGEARLVAAGHVQLSEDGKKPRRVSRPERIRFGDVVHVVSGSATITTAEGTRYELRPGELQFAATPMLVRGDVLVRTRRKAAEVEAAGSQALVRGTARLSRSLAVSAAVYEGEARLRSGGAPFTVPALRQATIPSIGVMPSAATPIAYDDRDEWDRRYLGAAMAFGRELEARSRAFGPNVARGEGRTPGFYRLLLPELEREAQFGGSLLDPARSAGETLVGATLAVSGTKATFPERWQSIFRFRDEGAAWGLVALDQAVNDVPDLVRRLDAAIGRAPLGFSPGRAAAPALPGSGDEAGGLGSGERARGDGGDGNGDGGDGTTTTRPPTTTTTTTPPTTTTTTPKKGPVPPPPPTGTPADDVAQPLVTPVVDTLNGLLTPQP